MDLAIDIDIGIPEIEEDFLIALKNWYDEGKDLGFLLYEGHCVCSRLVAFLALVLLLVFKSEWLQ